MPELRDPSVADLTVGHSEEETKPVASVEHTESAHLGCHQLNDGA